ncbi:hypothetical protein ACF05L_12530 [Streptomyces bobili]|uniref:hypothetical protein n=1 Tax=Streptomyces bobili TaxID=67280 RepID=UPI0036F7FCAE
MRTASPRGCARGAAGGVLLVLSVVDLEVASEEGYSVWPPAAVLVTGLAALLWPAHRRPATTVTVAVRHDACRLDVTVTDDGRGGTRLPAEATAADSAWWA